jgi:hypothetical protein
MTSRRTAATAAAVSLAIAGCNGVSDRAYPPSASSVFETTIENRVIDRVDILFDVENSREMGDVRGFLQTAIADLVSHLVNPNCVLAGVSLGPSAGGLCPAGTQPEFAPVHDLHVGVITSSLGNRLGDACPPQGAAPPPFDNVLAHNDDQGHLIDRTLTFAAGGAAVTEGFVADAPSPDPFLYWFPESLNFAQAPSAGTPVTPSTALVADVADLVGGAGAFGCELPSPLESWYRFLVQPDPYASLVVDGSGRAAWSGVDATLLRERHDFLRPDSQLVIVAVSAGGDKEVDVRSMGGFGYRFLSGAFQPPRGTSVCATDPGSPTCKSCAEPGTGSDPSCQMGPYTTPGDGGFDLATRFSHMKATYGVDPQFPIQRYVSGLTSVTVPDRDGEYPPGATSYAGIARCQNPIFAGSLPDGSMTDPATLCHPPPGSRSKELVRYVHVGGVPNDLLHYAPANHPASELNQSDWVKILGKDPLAYDLSGIDPRMLESSAHPQYACTSPQVGARAYPTARELLVAHLVGTQGVVASLCPIDAQDSATHDDPLYGYRPAFDTIPDRLNVELTEQCLPRALTLDPETTQAPCTLLVQLPPVVGGTCTRPTCDPAHGLGVPPPDVLDRRCRSLEEQHAAGGSAAGSDPARQSVCELTQLTPKGTPRAFRGGTCQGSDQPGWCYVTGAAAGFCPQAIHFAGGEPPNGAVVWVTCSSQ